MAVVSLPLSLNGVSRPLCHLFAFRPGGSPGLRHSAELSATPQSLDDIPRQKLAIPTETHNTHPSSLMSKQTNMLASSSTYFDGRAHSYRKHTNPLASPSPSGGERSDYDSKHVCAHASSNSAPVREPHALVARTGVWPPTAGGWLPPPGQSRRQCPVHAL
jgi:hypothetical protein